jgi:hypothetical protein
MLAKSSNGCRINIELPDVARLRQQLILDRDLEIMIAKAVFVFC